MEQFTRTRRFIRFGAFQADLRAGELRKQGLRIRLQEKPFQVLAALLERPGDVVLREELRSKLWPDDTFVDFDHSINIAINKLREALGDSAENPRFIETLARRGYRFMAAVEREEEPVEQPSLPTGADSLDDSGPTGEVRTGLKLSEAELGGEVGGGAATHSEPTRVDSSRGGASPPTWRDYIVRPLSLLWRRKRWAMWPAVALVFIAVFWTSLQPAARWYNNRGANFQQRGEVTLAIEMYRKALRLKSDYAEAHYNLADAYEEVSDYDRAIEEYQWAIRSDATFYQAYNNLARLYILRRTDYSAALRLLDRALSLQPQEPPVQYSLYKNHGWANFGLHLFGQAELDLRRALVLDQDRGAAHCLLAQVLEAQGKQSAALREWEPCAAYASGDRDVEPDWRSLAQERLSKEESK